MSVNLLPKYRVLAFVAVVGIASTALAWSGDHRVQLPYFQGRDTMPTSNHTLTKKPGHKKSAKEGRVARELDLRMDVEDIPGLPEMDDMPGIPEMDTQGDMDIQIDLDALKSMSIAEEDLKVLKDLNIDDEIWNELKDLKVQMDELCTDLEEEQLNGINNYRLQMETDAIIDAMRAEIPKVRREVQKALQEYEDSDGRDWQ
jgi:hypothetical protein